MRYLMASVFLFLAAACSAGAQDAPKLGVSPSNNYLFACRSKAAMKKVMNSGPGLNTNPTVVNPLVKNGDCVLVPYEFIKTIGYATDKGYGPAPVTVEKEHGTVTMWGYPVDD